MNFSLSDLWYTFAAVSLSNSGWCCRCSLFLFFYFVFFVRWFVILFLSFFWFLSFVYFFFEVADFTFAIWFFVILFCWFHHFKTLHTITAVVSVLYSSFLVLQSTFADLCYDINPFGDFNILDIFTFAVCWFVICFPSYCCFLYFDWFRPLLISMFPPFSFFILYMCYAVSAKHKFWIFFHSIKKWLFWTDS